MVSIWIWCCWQIVGNRACWEARESSPRQDTASEGWWWNATIDIIVEKKLHSQGNRRQHSFEGQQSPQNISNVRLHCMHTWSLRATRKKSSTTTTITTVCSSLLLLQDLHYYCCTIIIFIIVIPYLLNSNNLFRDLAICAGPMMLCALELAGPPRRVLLRAGMSCLGLKCHPVGSCADYIYDTRM